MLRYCTTVVSRKLERYYFKFHMIFGQIKATHSLKHKFMTFFCVTWMTWILPWIIHSFGHLRKDFQKCQGLFIFLYRCLRNSNEVWYFTFQLLLFISFIALTVNSPVSCASLKKAEIFYGYFDTLTEMNFGRVKGM